ncbi:hypothetical protein BC629DRAFT_1598637 [Irpex lacteus]|nr:hypothetical protein BC629DRAFT_1598637 [Irpex lacteus]
MAQRDEISEDEKPLKKRKLNAGSQSQTQAAAEQQRQQPNGNVEVPSVAPSLRGVEDKRHPTLWFPDGSLTVTSADGVTFKLHPGLLGCHSEVLKDRIATFVPSGNLQPESGSEVDGHRETTLHLAENGDNLSEFFGMIYYGKAQTMYYNLETRIPFYHFYRILRLGVKYKVQHIVESGFARLEQAFSPDYDVWVGSDKTFCADSDSCPIEMEAKDTIPLIILARDAKCTRLLPVMLYVCASEVDSTYLLNGVSYSSETFKLDIADQLNCVDARLQLQEIESATEQIFLRAAFDGPIAKCATRHTCIAVCKYLVLKAAKINVFVMDRPSQDGANG